VGDYLAWRTIHRRLRERSAEVEANSVASLVSARGKSRMGLVRLLAALVTLAFLGSYAAAQLTAGGKAVSAVFGWPAASGAVLSAALILMYSLLGGLKASIWTNTAQSIVMMSTILLLLATALYEVGGLGPLWSQLRAIDPALIDWKPQDPKFGVALFILSWIVAGIGVLGQPHLVTLTMSIQDAESLKRARPVYFAWYVVFSAACILVGLCCRALLDRPGAAAFDQELALPQLAMRYLHPLWVGVVIAGLFAATMSTADTQIICCSAAVSQDLWTRLGRQLWSSRLVTAVCALAVLTIALVARRSVFELVVLSWSALASALGPLVILQACRRPLTPLLASAVLIGGLSTALAWRYWLELSDSLYEVMPGMAAGFVIYLLGSLLIAPANAAEEEAPT
jgi:sodium/proline symporter